MHEVSIPFPGNLPQQVQSAARSYSASPCPQISPSTIQSRPGLFRISRRNGPKCARDGFGSTSFELSSPFPHLPFMFLPSCYISVDNPNDRYSCGVKKTKYTLRINLSRLTRSAHRVAWAHGQFLPDHGQP